MNSRRGRAWVRWTLLGATVAIVAVLGLSGWFMLSIELPGSQIIDVAGGRVFFTYNPLGFRDGHAPTTTIRRARIPWSWRLEYYRFMGWGIYVPMWMPLAALGAGAAWSWRRCRAERRHACWKCRYDRHGLLADVLCPECGAPPPTESVA